MKKQSFLQGAFILVCANLLVKVIGAGFKIPLTYLIHEEGMGLFGAAYTVYTVLFVIATAGFPIAVSKMVSESIAVGRQNEARRIFHVAVLMLCAVGMIGAVVLYFGAPFFAALLKSEGAVYSIRAIAPAVLFVSLAAALRGYFQGHQNMLPTAYSEVVEALGKLTVGYALALNCMSSGVEKAAAGAIIGVTTGTAIGFFLLLCVYAFKREKSHAQGKAAYPLRSKRAIARQLIGIAVPITVGASVASLTTLIDMATITRRLQSITQVSADFISRYGALIDAKSFDGSIGEKLATSLYGLYSGYAIPLFNLPLTIVAALAMSVVPAISSAIAVGNKHETELVTKSALRITLLLALPCGGGIFVLASPVLSFLFSNSLAVSLLQKLSLAIVFVSLLSVTTAILQAYGKQTMPMINMLIGGIVKIAVNYVLVGNPKYNIDGAPIGTTVCYFVIVLLNIICLIRVTDFKFKLVGYTTKPLVSALLMSVLVRALYELLMKFSFPLRISVAASIALGAAVYAVLVLISGAVGRQELSMLPGGKRLCLMLTKAKLIK